MIYDNLIRRQIKKVGVITTIYNDSKNIFSCIDTVKTQNFENVTHYIYDDGSTDGLESIINSISNNNIVYIRCPENRGIAFSRNVCLTRAIKDGCQIIAMLDSDDLWEPFHLSESIFYLDKYDLIYSHPIIKNPQGEVLHPNWLVPEEFDKTILQHSNFIWTSSVVAKSECFNSISFDETLNYHDDWRMWISISNNGFTIFNKKSCSTTYFWDNKKWNHDLVSSEAKKITNNNSSIAKVLVLGFSYNESRLMPHFLQHYSTIADKIIIIEGDENYDYEYLSYTYNHEIDIIKSKKLDDLELTNLRNNYWKKYKNDFDYIIVVDIDEFLDITKNTIQTFKDENITLPLIDGYQMISYNFPVDFSEVKLGFLDHTHLNKQIIFSSKLEEINYGVGCHICFPIGEINYSLSPHNLLHFKYIGFQSFKQKSLKAHNRLSDINKINNFGYHYYNDANMSKIEFELMLTLSSQVPNNLPHGQPIRKILEWLITDQYINFKPIFDEIIIENLYGLTVDNIEGRDVIDIGANLGFVSLLTAILGANQIIAVEPVSTTFNSLTSNIKKSNFKNIKTFKNIVSSTPNNKINISADYESVCNGLYTDSNTYEVVETITLSELLSHTNGNNVYLKMDCEGSEYDIILSAKDEDMDKITTIGLEIHRDLHPIYKGDDVIYKKLKSFGFKQQVCNRMGTWFGNSVFEQSPQSVEVWYK